ncbi:MAG TPA: hypothetical protein V6C65_05470, partial [Allocoleopsis sp.]
MLKAQIYNLIGFQSRAGSRGQGVAKSSRLRQKDIPFRGRKYFYEIMQAFIIRAIDPSEVDDLQQLALKIFYVSFAAL